MPPHSRAPLVNRFRLALVTLALVLAATVADIRVSHAESLEETVCISVLERFAFWLWSSVAGTPDPTLAAAVPNAEPIVHQTRDGRLLRGYKLRSTAADGAVTARMLVAQGNAMLAEELLPSLTYFSRAGIETTVFDYRGYGDSQGAPRLKAIASDYRELFDALDASGPGKRFLYGISFGGIVSLAVVGSGIAVDRVVIDSTPSRISHFGCPQSYDPVANLPRDSSRVLIVAGERDRVVPAGNSRELREVAESRGARTELHADYAHPFMDSDPGVARARLELIRAFLLAGDEQAAQ
ncbi:MAG: alpha/beta fold hydrolase [Deltaproteobacteria bacterium]|nr:alpha/beta fold hydrolase [Deltaproteobacteria bacterium]